MSRDFGAQVSRAYKFFKNLGLANRHNDKVSYQSIVVDKFRDFPYREQWEYFWKNKYYDILMNDLSIIQFKPPTEQNPEYSFCYYDSPIMGESYEQFLIGLGFSMKSEGYQLWEDYEESILSAPLKQYVTPIRFDYSPNSYREGVHPTAHIHIGLENHVRIATHKLLEPLSFSLFVARQTKPEHWSKFLKRNDASVISRCVRTKLQSIPQNHWNEKDSWEMYLT